MFDHVTIRVSDLATSRRFYELALGEPTHVSEYVEWGAFGIVADGPPSSRLHAAVGVADRPAVDAWWSRLTEAGYESDGEPGERPQYSPTYYGGFVLDPDGNSIEAVHHDHVRAGELDHLWLRTRDVARTKDFYATVADAVGILLVHHGPDRVTFGFGERKGSFTFAAGEPPSARVHLAFGVSSTEAVAEFHRAATAAGYRDNGAPGERPRYHPGYHGAFVLDPDGHNVEAVFHDRRST